MTVISLAKFIATLKVVTDDPRVPGEDLYTYWNNDSATSEDHNLDEVLHIVRQADGSFYLQIANLIQEGSLEDLEECLYKWANDEGWFD